MAIGGFSNLAGMVFVDSKGMLTATAQNLLTQLLNTLNNLSNTEGLAPPNLSSDANSVTPSATGGQIAQVAAGIAANTAVRKAVLVMDQSTGSLPGGVLKLIKFDGSIHTIA